MIKKIFTLLSDEIIRLENIRDYTPGEWNESLELQLERLNKAWDELEAIPGVNEN